MIRRVYNTCHIQRPLLKHKRSSSTCLYHRGSHRASCMGVPKTRFLLDHPHSLASRGCGIYQEPSKSTKRLSRSFLTQKAVANLVLSSLLVSPYKTALLGYITCRSWRIPRSWASPWHPLETHPGQSWLSSSGVINVGLNTHGATMP